MLLRVEKVCAPEMCVPLWVAGADGSNVDGRLDDRGLGVVRIPGHAPRDLLELSANSGDHHVADAEFDRRVGRID
jgi:hypothetical protein